MKRILTSLLTLLAIVSMVGSLGCGTGASNPATPAMSSLTHPGDGFGAQETDGTSLLGMYDVMFDPETMELEAAETREADLHYNITTLITPNTVITLVSYNPAAQQLVFDVAITNATKTSVYDLRTLFLSSPASGYTLLNPDDYTALFNPYGPGVVNPFRAYAKTAPNRVFATGATYTERFQVQTPAFASTVFQFTLLIECSRPGNCDDVYEISNQTLSNPISAGTSGTIKLQAFDWQGNIGQIYVDTTPITGGFTWLTNTGGNTWSGGLHNSAGALPGIYRCLIVADSFSSADNLYDYINIQVLGAAPLPVPPPPPPPPVNPPVPPLPPPPNPPPPPPPNPPVPPVPPPNPPQPPQPPPNPPQPPPQPPNPPPLPPPNPPPQPPIPPPPPNPGG